MYGYRPSKIDCQEGYHQYSYTSWNRRLTERYRIATNRKLTSLSNLDDNEAAAIVKTPRLHILEEKDDFEVWAQEIEGVLRSKGILYTIDYYSSYKGQMCLYDEHGCEIKLDDKQARETILDQVGPSRAALVSG